MQGTTQRTDVDVLRDGYRRLNETTEAPAELFEDPTDFTPASDVTMTPTELVYECRGRICVRVWVKARRHETDAKVTGHVFHVWTMRNGKAISWREFTSRREAMEAALDERSGLPIS
jgi:ketosteroid isomerase-like protein